MINLEIITGKAEVYDVLVQYLDKKPINLNTTYTYTKSLFQMKNKTKQL